MCAANHNTFHIDHGVEPTVYSGSTTLTVGPGQQFNTFMDAWNELYGLVLETDVTIFISQAACDQGTAGTYFSMGTSLDGWGYENKVTIAAHDYGNAWACTYGTNVDNTGERYFLKLYGVQGLTVQRWGFADASGTLQSQPSHGILIDNSTLIIGEPGFLLNDVNGFGLDVQQQRSGRLYVAGFPSVLGLCLSTVDIRNKRGCFPLYGLDAHNGQLLAVRELRSCTGHQCQQLPGHHLTRA